MSRKRRDGRSFAFIAHELLDNRKLAELDSPLAGWLYVAGILYAGRNLTDGELPAAAVARRANVPARWIAELVRVGLWHAEGHQCPRCPQPAPGRHVVHDYLEHQQSRAEVEARADSNRRAAEARWNKRPPLPADPGPHDDLHGLTDVPDEPPSTVEVPMHSASTTHAQRSADTEAEAEAPPTGVPETPLLTLVGRLAVGDARVRDPACLPALVEGWQELAGPGVDLEAEARAYLERHLGNPARDELSAWRGWLTTGRRNRTRLAQPALVELPLVAVPPARPAAPPGPPVRTFVPCPDHPAHPTAHCPECIRHRAAAPAAILEVAQRHRRKAS